ncbi:MFS transporter [Candidatus Enterococcus mansonii]|uniref:Drug resistance transporter, EmrB/QacA family protein n=1 Tax=Candidatus Enterococcus mansonii TaxID=1834181 RepID=A0A242C5R7_9ENTE|nr:MFS transporter [Enterococcus sp. 4G2_DIV0659]OTO05526.1 drug resistance transporter, EmrB/QacA family protein [Enterococcus sp. 4G2_DIV0659]
MDSFNNFQDNPIVQKNRWWILISAAMFTFMSTLDASIVNIALPTISTDMNVPMNQAVWIVSIYLMVICACLLLFGKIGDSFGKINSYRIGTIIFTIGSLLCGFNPSLKFLLFARIIQGIGSSMTMATNAGIITEVFPLNERGRALGSLGAFVSLGSIAGPGIGGIILSHFSWPYIFWINVPVGLLTIFIGEKFLPKDIIKSGKKVDMVGFSLFALFIMTFFGAIFIGQEIGFTASLSLILFVAAVISLIVFIRIEKNVSEPLITFAIFKNNLFTISLITAVLIFSSNFFVNVMIPFYLQNARGISASSAGLLMMVFPLLMVIGSPISGYLIDKIGTTLLTVTGLLLLSITALMYMFLNQGTPLWYYILATGIMGLGNALFQSSNNTTVMSSVAKEDLGVAGSMNSFARNLGMVLGIALATTILYKAMSSAYGQRVTTYISTRPDVFIFGMRITFLGSFILCLTALLLTLFRLAKKKQ